MEPITTALTGIALVQKSVDFIKQNISTANDIKDIAGALDGLFAGEKQIQQERFGNKSMLGQTKDAAHMVIDAKLAKESMDDDLIISYSDIIYKKSVLEKLIRSKKHLSVVVDKNWEILWKMRMENYFSDIETLRIKNQKIII